VTKNIARSAGIFVLYNVVFGAMNGTTDLSAHFGGLISGFLVGMLLVRPRSAAASSLTTNP
jgi:membrane associated rhomboid family serine protease